MKRLTDHVLLTSDEYESLITAPEQCYAFMTKTAAKQTVKLLLKHENFKCYHDRTPKPDRDDACCGQCPLMKIFGMDIGNRLCEKDKWWSK